MRWQLLIHWWPSVGLLMSPCHYGCPTASLPEEKIDLYSMSDCWYSLQNLQTVPLQQSIRVLRSILAVAKIYWDTSRPTCIQHRGDSRYGLHSQQILRVSMWSLTKVTTICPQLTRGSPRRCRFSERARVQQQEISQGLAFQSRGKREDRVLQSNC